MVEGGLVKVGWKKDAVLNIYSQVVNRKLLVNVLVGFALKTAAVKLCKVPVAFGRCKVNFFNSEPD